MDILITTKDSTQIEEALRLSAQISEQAGKQEIRLTIFVYLKRSDATEAKTLLADIHKKIDDYDLQAEAHVGLSIADIVQESKKEKYDLVILVESCHSREKPSMRGPMSLRIVKSTPNSVLVLQESYTPLNQILLCDSGAETFQSVLDFTTKLLGLLPGDHNITVLHVMSQISAGPGVSGKQLRAEAEELIEEQTPEGKLLQNDLEELDQPGIHPSPKVRHGLVVEEISAEANSEDYDLVVIGAPQQEGWQRFLLENITEKIIKQIDRSVLVVKS
jgi:nucleotide-binding universal stress UspA family protein